MELTPDLLPLSVMPVSHHDASEIAGTLHAGGIDYAVNPPLHDIADFVADGVGWDRSIGSHSVYVRPEDLARALATIRENHTVPGYLLTTETER
jgi:hypothetical protein